MSSAHIHRECILWDPSGLWLRLDKSKYEPYFWDKFDKIYFETELTTYDALFGFIQNCSLFGFGGRFCSSSNKLMLPYCQTSSRASFFSQSAQGGPQVTCLRLGKFSHPALHTHYCFLRSCSLEMVPKVKHATTIIWYAVTQTIF